MIAIWVIVLIAILVGIFSFGAGWFLAISYFKKQMKENPPISESQIRDLYKKLGRKPSERQVKQIISNFKQNS